MNYYNLIKVNQLLTDTCTPLFESIYFKDVADFAQSPDKKYLSINFDLQNIQLQNFDTNNNAILTFNYNVTVADLQDVNVTDTTLFCINNAIEKSTDLIAMLNNIQDINIDVNQFTPFTDSTGDIISGITFGLSVQISYALSKCVA